MNRLKLLANQNIPPKFTGIVEFENGSEIWYKNGKWHRTDGAAWIRNDDYKEWYLNGKLIWKPVDNLMLKRQIILTDQIILSKSKHPEYPTVQVWKILDKDKVYEQLVIPGMEEHIKE